MILGLDPGLKGGYALLDDGKIIQSGAFSVDGGLIQTAQFVEAIRLHTPEPVMAIIEQVHAMPGQGVTSMFSFGKGFGQLIGVCQALKWPFVLVTPQAWKGKVLAGTPKDKDAAIAFVRARYPEVNLTQPGCRTLHDGVADAVCLAHYGATLCR